MGENNTARTENRGLSSNCLKYIAIFAMTLDHIAWAFVPTATLLGQLLHAFGRLTIVIMSLFISEGFVHTKSFNRYLGRLLIFAVISQPFYLLFSFRNGFAGHNLADYFDFNVLFSLSMALIGLKVYESRMKLLPKTVIIIILCVLSYYCDWCFFPILFTLVFYITRNNKSNQMLSFALLALAVTAFYIIRFSIKYNCSYVTAFKYDGMMLGLFAGLVPVYLYNGKLGKVGKSSKWLFYTYYPLHLGVLWILTKTV